MAKKVIIKTDVEATFIKDHGTHKKGAKVMMHKNTAEALRAKGIIK